MIAKPANMLAEMCRVMSANLDPAGYIAGTWGEAYPWQKEAMNPLHKRVILNCARQSGKSTIVAGIAIHTAKYTPGSLTIIVAPAEKQAAETMKKVKDFINADRELDNQLTKDSNEEVMLENGSRILCLPGTERSVRGYSGPHCVIVDEASKVLDETYKAIRPMLTGQSQAKLIILSTPWNKAGFFHKEWTENKVWKKILVKPSWVYDDDLDLIVKAPPEKEFRDYWAKFGVSAYYSTRHEKHWLEEELESIGPIWFKREYGCEFIEGMESLFTEAMIESAFDDSIKVLFGDEDQTYDNVEVPDFEGYF